MSHFMFLIASVVISHQHSSHTVRNALRKRMVVIIRDSIQGLLRRPGLHNRHSGLACLNLGALPVPGAFLGETTRILGDDSKFSLGKTSDWHLATSSPCPFANNSFPVPSNGDTKSALAAGLVTVLVKLKASRDEGGSLGRQTGPGALVLACAMRNQGWIKICEGVTLSAGLIAINRFIKSTQPLDSVLGIRNCAAFISFIIRGKLVTVQGCRPVTIS
jgi:hypothetical protein